MKDWFECPHRWKIKNLTDFKEPPNIYFVTGSVFHLMNEVTCDLSNEFPDSSTWPSWFDTLEAETRKRWVSEFGSSDSVLEGFYKDSMQTLMPLAKVIYPTEYERLTKDTLANEAWAYVNLPGAKGWYAHGYIDRIYINGNKIDFKTASKRWTPWQKFEEPQAWIYPMLTMSKNVYFKGPGGDIIQKPMPKPESENFAFAIAVKHVKPTLDRSYQYEELWGIGDEKRKATLAMMSGIARQIEVCEQLGYFYPNPIKGKCNLCQVRKQGLCPVRPKFIEGVDDKGVDDD